MKNSIFIFIFTLGILFSVSNVHAFNSFPNTNTVSTNNYVFAIVTAEDGSVYIGGQFTTVGGVARNHIAKINSDGTLNTNWNPNVNNSVVSLLIYNNKLYAGGTFTTVNGGTTRNNLAAFNLADGTVDSWDPNMNSFVNSLICNNNKLYVGGNFTTVNGGTTRNRLAEFDLSNNGVLTSWDPNMSGSVRSLAIYENKLYVGGDFTAVGGIARNNLAVFDLINTPVLTSVELDILLDGQIKCLLVYNGYLYIGGEFINDDANFFPILPALLRFNLSTGLVDFNWKTGIIDTFSWSLDNFSNSFLVSNNKLYVGGNFETINVILDQDWNIVSQSIRRRAAAFNLTDGTVDEWDPNMSSIVYSLATSNDGTKLYVGGNFMNEGGGTYTQTYFAQYDTPDTTPTSFTFTDQTDVAKNTTIESNTITVAGIDSSTPISISSCTGTNCMYKINDGVYTADAGTLVSGDTVTVKQTSSVDTNTTTNLILDIGGVTDTFSITTVSIIPPTITTSEPTTIARTSITLNGNITNTGGEDVTRGFNYGLTDIYGTTTVDSGTYSTGTYTKDITGLECNTTYHYRAYATNSAGTTNGDDTTFTTNRCPSSSGSSSTYMQNFLKQNTTTPKLETPTNTPQIIKRTLRLNSLSEEVRDIQKYLNTHNFVIAKTGPGSLNNETTKFGPLTKKAVIRFQKANNLTPDGIVGKKTLELMK